MFEFTDLDGMSRTMLLKKQKEAVDYWRQMHRLKGAWIGWQRNTIEFVNIYKASGGASDLTKAIDNAAIKGEITLKKLDNQIQRVNEYLASIDVRLADGTKWYSAAEIQSMANELYESEVQDA